MDQSDRNDQTAGLSTLTEELDGFINAPVIKRSVLIAGHATSVSLEQPFWTALQSIAYQRDMSLNTLISEIDNCNEGNLSSALRLFVLHSLSQ